MYILQNSKQIILKKIKGMNNTSLLQSEGNRGEQHYYP